MIFGGLTKTIVFLTAAGAYDRWDKNETSVSVLCVSVLCVSVFNQHWILQQRCAILNYV